MGFLEALAGAGNILDLPGSSLRDVLVGEDPFDQWSSPTTGEGRATGRDLLRSIGLIGEEDTTVNAIGGMLAEILVDPLNLIGGALIGRSARAGKAAKASNILSREQRAAGFMPAEIAENTVARNREGPVRFLHGTGTDFFRPDPESMSNNSVMGWGHYMAEEGVPRSAEDILEENMAFLQTNEARKIGLPLSELDLDDLAERLRKEGDRLEPYGDWLDEPWLTRPEGSDIDHLLYEPTSRPTHYVQKKGRASSITEGYSGYETEKYKVWDLHLGTVSNEDVVDMTVPFFSKVDDILQRLGPEGKAASDQLSEASVKILDKIGPDAQRTWPGISGEFQDDVYKDVLQPAMDAIKERAYRGNTEYTLPDNAREWLVDSQMQLRKLYDNAFTVEFGPQTQTRYVDIRKPFDVSSTNPEVLSRFSDELGDWAEEALGERLPMSFEEFTRTRDLGTQVPYGYLNEFLMDLPRTGPDGPGLGLGERLQDVLAQGASERGHSRYALSGLTSANTRNQLLHELGYDAMYKPRAGIWAVMNPEDIYLPYVADAIRSESGMSPLGLSLLGSGLGASLTTPDQ